MYITTSGNVKMYLTDNQIMEIREQLTVADTLELLRFYGCTNAEELDEEKLLEIGWAVDDNVCVNKIEKEVEALGWFPELKFKNNTIRVGMNGQEDKVFVLN